jgi:glycosyltransferase involved in cell wall biosynthesis
VTATTISVIIPVFNGASYLAEAVNSALAQTYPPVEVIIVDDGSTDDSVAVAQAYRGRVRILSQPHAGAAAARNLGVGASTGELLAFLDADDRWPASKLHAQSDLLRSAARLDGVFGYVRQLRHGATWDAGVSERVADTQGAVRGYVAGAMLVRRDAFLRVGLFRTDWRTGEFIDWFARAEEAGLKFGLVAEVVLWRRIHASNFGIRNRDAAVEYTRIVRESLRRRRGGGEQPT